MIAVSTPGAMDLLGAWFGSVEGAALADPTVGGATASTGFGALLAALDATGADPTSTLLGPGSSARSPKADSEQELDSWPTALAWASALPEREFEPPLSGGVEPSEPGVGDEELPAMPGDDVTREDVAAKDGMSAKAPSSNAPIDDPHLEVLALQEAAPDANAITATTTGAVDAGASNLRTAAPKLATAAAVIGGSFAVATATAEPYAPSELDPRLDVATVVRASATPTPTDPTSGPSPKTPPGQRPVAAMVMPALPQHGDASGASANGTSTAHAASTDPHAVAWSSTRALREPVDSIVPAGAPLQLEVRRVRERGREDLRAVRAVVTDLGRRLTMQVPASAVARSMSDAQDPARAAHARTDVPNAAALTSATAQSIVEDPLSVAPVPAAVSGGTPAIVPGADSPRPDAASESRTDAIAETEPETHAVRAPLLREAPSTSPSEAPLDLGARLRLAIAHTLVEAGRERLLASVRDHFEAQVTVRPANLGTVQILVSREAAQGGLNVLLVAAHEDAARALEDGIDELVDDLVRHRLEVNEVSVRRGEGPAHEAPRDGHQRSAGQDQAQRERREEAEARQRADERDPERRRSAFERWGLQPDGEEASPQHASSAEVGR